MFHTTVLRRLAVRSAPDGATIDLTTVQWLTPGLLVGVAAQAQRVRAGGVTLRVEAPRDRDCADYAARMRLGLVLERLGVAHDLPTVTENDLSDRLIELTPFADASEIAPLAELVHAKTAPRDLDAANTIFQSLSELASNVADHAQAPGFALAQTMRTRDELRFAVADSGVGLLGSLAARGAVDSADAILRALGGVSRLDEPERGNGLRRIVQTIVGLAGEASLASGDAWHTAEGPSVRRGAAEPAYRGVIFEARIPISAGRHRLRAPSG